MIELSDTNSAAIASQFLRARRKAGSPAMGMVMTLVFVVDEQEAEDALETARAASREHPARVLGVIRGSTRGPAKVDAKVGIGSGWAGETALITLSGEVARHPESVVLPLLLPDSPVVVWWPTKAPAAPGEDPLGRLAKRRITDAAAAPRARAKALLTQCESYTPGNTDLAWTRITSWRAMLAAALDQHPGKVLGASVSAERISPSADLLSAWLTDRLRTPVTRRVSEGPGITSVVLTMRDGEVSLHRPDGVLATLSSPGQPDRPVALRRRELAELLSEELHRLDPDDIYADTVRRMAKESAKRKAAKRSSKKSSAGAKSTRAKSTRASPTAGKSSGKADAQVTVEAS